MISQTQAKDLIDLIVPDGEFSADQMNPLLTFLNQFTNYIDVDPTANDDVTQNYIGMRSTWYNSVTGKIYICIDDTATAAVWLDITPATNANSASVVNITKANLIAAVNGGTVNTFTQYRISDSTQGIIRVYGVSTGAIDTLGFKEGSYDGITYVNGEIGLYNISTDVFTVNTGAPSLQNVYNTGNTVNTWDLRMISNPNGQIGIVKNANFAGSFDIIAFGDAANASATTTRAISIGTNANSSANGNDRVSLGKLSGCFGAGSNVNTMGYEAGRLSKSSNLNAFGYQANHINVTAVATDHINALGNSAALNNLASYVNAIGKEAAANNTAQGAYLIAIGDGAGKGNGAPNCTFIGSSSGENNLGQRVNALGYFAASGNHSNGAIAIGQFSLLDNYGYNSIAIGSFAGALNTKGECVFIGTEAGYDQTTGIGNALNGPSFVISNQNLPVYANSTAADTAITVANGAVAGSTYLYYNTANKSIGAVRL